MVRSVMAMTKAAPQVKSEDYVDLVKVNSKPCKSVSLIIPLDSSDISLSLKPLRLGVD